MAAYTLCLPKELEGYRPFVLLLNHYDVRVMHRSTRELGPPDGGN